MYQYSTMLINGKIPLYKDNLIQEIPLKKSVKDENSFLIPNLQCITHNEFESLSLFCCKSFCEIANNFE